MFARPTFAAFPTNDDHKIVVEASGMFGTAHMTLPITLEQFYAAWKRYASGELIQRAFPMLNGVQREFLITGMSEEAQEVIFAAPDEEDE